MGVNSLPKTVTRQRRGCDLNPGPSAPESSTLTTRQPSHLHKVHNTKIHDRPDRPPVDPQMSSTSSFVRHFHRLPTEDILAANLAAADRPGLYADISNDDDQLGGLGDVVTRSRRDWDSWVRRNRFVSIGKLFDKCGETSRC